MLQKIVNEFFNDLREHDWYYEMSDDSSVFRKGKENEERLIHLSKASPILKKMLVDFKQHYFSGEPWGTKKAPMPVLENYEVAE